MLHKKNKKNSNNPLKVEISWNQTNRLFHTVARIDSGMDMRNRTDLRACVQKYTCTHTCAQICLLRAINHFYERINVWFFFLFLSFFFFFFFYRVRDDSLVLCVKPHAIVGWPTGDFVLKYWCQRRLIVDTHKRTLTRKGAVTRNERNSGRRSRLLIDCD